MQVKNKPWLPWVFTWIWHCHEHLPKADAELLPGFSLLVMSVKTDTHTKRLLDKTSPNKTSPLQNVSVTKCLLVTKHLLTKCLLDKTSPAINLRGGWWQQTAHAFHFRALHKLYGLLLHETFCYIDVLLQETHYKAMKWIKHYYPFSSFGYSTFCNLKWTHRPFVIQYFLLQETFCSGDIFGFL
jgi:hypothetical protein